MAFPTAIQGGGGWRGGPREQGLSGEKDVGPLGLVEEAPTASLAAFYP